MPSPSRVFSLMLLGRGGGKPCGSFELFFFFFEVGGGGGGGGEGEEEERFCSLITDWL